MKSEKIIPGLILVLLGTVFLLDNYHVIDFHWASLWRFWPVFLIMGGVNLVFANNRSTWATGLKIAVVLLGFALIVFVHTDKYYFFNNKYAHMNDDHFMWFKHNGDDDDDDDNSDSTGIVKVEGSSTYNEPFTPTATAAKLNISGGGTSYTLNDSTSELFNAVTKERYNRYTYTHTMEGTTPVLNLSMKEKKGHINWDSDGNAATIKLNVNPVWDININAGATELKFDLSKFKIKNLIVNGGAGSFDVKLGMPVAVTTIEVSTGVSEVDIQVPQNAACQIVSNSGLSSDEFTGFNKISSSLYQTKDFEKSPNKLYIVMKGGLSNFKVTRY